MRKATDPLSDFRELRQKAEERLSDRKSESAPASGRINGDQRASQLELHELELELQNEELRCARLELEASLERYSEIFDFAPVGYVTVSLDGIIREVNHSAARLLRRTRGQLVDKPLSALIAAGDRARFSELFRAALVSETRELCEVELMHDGGEPTYVQLIAALLARAEPLFLVALEDITERKLGERQLTETTRLLREADRRKDEFLGILSHELRNPLAPIQNSLFVLSRVEPGGPRARASLAIIERQVGHLTRLIDDLLDVTRIARGKVELRCEALEIRQLLERTLQDQSPVFETAGLRLHAELGSSPVWVHADTVRLTQAFNNVLGNALKFTPRGGQVSVRLSVEGTRVQVVIEDTGVGIDPEVVPRLFEPFFQAEHSLGRSAGGLGLGLATARGLIELHGGTVCLHSEGRGCGVQVKLELPVSRAAAQVGEGRLAHPHRGRRVLVIDDHRDTLESLRDALSFGGHAVQVAADGPCGIELARRFAPEVVFCDIGLPGMDGYEVARAFRADPVLRSVHLVALSGYAQTEAIGAATSAGFDQHVAKPPGIEELEELLAKVPQLAEAVVDRKTRGAEIGVRNAGTDHIVARAAGIAAAGLEATSAPAASRAAVSPMLPNQPAPSRALPNQLH
ncbi:MAG TPA: ATP-binding protein [Polyangiaceae bacterium]|nr:ATP-binding protein [Polyangiaceae bacterium]